MKLFGKRPRRSASGLTVIDERLSIHGDLETDGTVRVDGHVSGSAHRLGTLVVGPRGSITGDIVATDVVVAGTVSGNVEARGRVEIEAGASITGNVHAASLTVRDGASINGQFRVQEIAAPAETHDIDVPFMHAHEPVHDAAA